VISAIEVLSPSNKARGRDNESYRRKIDSYIEGGVNVVEIDLLRSRRHDLIVQVDLLPDRLQTPYLVSIHRATRNDGSWEVYPISLRDPFPTIAVPCRATDRDVPLALQLLIEKVYVEGAHDDIDYRLPPDPPFIGEDAEWSNTILAARATPS